MNNIKIDNAKNIDVAMSMYNSIDYSDNYLKKTDVYRNSKEMNNF